MYTRKEGEGKKKLQKKSVWKQRGPVLNVPLGSVINGADEKGTNGSCIITEPGLCHTNCSRHGALFPAEREAHIACVHTELRAPMCLIRAHKRENTKTDNAPKPTVPGDLSPKRENIPRSQTGNQAR